MKAFIRDRKYNFVDDNNRFVGFDAGHNCCESFGWFIAPKLCDNDLDWRNGGSEPAELEGFNFDPCFFESIKCADLDHGGAAAFRLVHADGRQLFLHLWCEHNGYYSHEFQFRSEDKTIIKEGWL